MELVWSWYGVGMELVWSWYGDGMEMVITKPEENSDEILR